ncbi:MAG: nucleoside:proton symporter [Pseudomonadales bacterium]|nr:nucleoside:proton symporter [Pseudomonadales bacterium]MBO6597825.1 nucleoside:proton symporter [Pseudomonadales bacterium]MBO6658820.1 nucleoside:proton symporter [Pseudomonadales bacterium]MBO6702353.1 nucleoside:proton symporter [Pseudomonadales bacterium]MBO6824233.1 nucleoside:proton symporter [Pseudomonadales bacterium]
MLLVQSLVGLGCLIGLCYLFSANRKDVRFPIVIKSLLLQIVFALLLLKLPASQKLFVVLNDGISVLQAATREGTTFIFGYLGGGPLPFEETSPGGGFILAFQAMPLVIVLSVISAVLMYLKILPVIMRGFSLILEKTLEIGGALGLGVSANAFLGMIESPLLIKPYLSKLSHGEMFAIMTAGMATIAGTMLALEAAVISSVVPNAIGHLISCSLITLPGVIYISHLLVPDRSAVTSGDGDVERGADNLMDAISTGTANGLQLFLNIIAMIIVIVALVYLLNAILGVFPDVAGEAITLERILGVVMAPLTMMMGIPFSEAFITGQLMGTKVVLTEFVAYVRFGQMPVEELTERTRIIMTYALCGFANFVSLGIMITGLITIVPERKNEIMEMGFKSIVAGTIATCTTATIVGIIISF